MNLYCVGSYGNFLMQLNMHVKIKEWYENFNKYIYKIGLRILYFVIILILVNTILPSIDRNKWND